MKQDIRNKDKNGNLHGVQIYYYSNGNIWFIRNYHHGICHGYRASFNPDNSIRYKEYRYMSKIIYEEDHCNGKQIEINI